VNNAQAVQSGRAGVDWARYVLESTDDLDSVRIATPPPGITGVIARRGNTIEEFEAPGDSTGTVFTPPYTPIYVRAVANQGNQESAVLAKFTPSPGQDIYKRLMTVMDRLEIKRDDDAERFGNTLLTGSIRMGTVRIEDYAGDTIDIIATPLKGTNCVDQQAFPRPEADLASGEVWWEEKYKAAQYIPPNDPITIGPTGAVPGIYKTDPGQAFGSPDSRWWSAVLEGNQCNVNVRGTSIWMFPDGLRCNDQLKLTNIGTGPATVIMVSRPTPGPPSGGPQDENDVGFALLGGIFTVANGSGENVNVFMISTGGVEIEHSEQPWHDKEGRANYLSIYADWVRLMGPSEPNDMNLYHGTSCNDVPPQDVKDGVVDQLIEANLLPNSRFARRRLAFVPGTWNENPTPVRN